MNYRTWFEYRPTTIRIMPVSSRTLTAARYVLTVTAAVTFVLTVVPRALAASPPIAPVNVSVVSEDADSVRVRFADMSTNEERFVIQRSPTRDGAYTDVRIMIDHTSGQPGRTNVVFQTSDIPKIGPVDCYRVRARNSSGDGVSARACIGPTRSVAFSFRIQKPYDIPVNERYAYTYASNTHTTRVLDTDKPHTPSSDTAPRTEMRWTNEYSSGRHMWESDVFVPTGVNGPTLMQVKHIANDTERTTDFQLRVHPENGGTFSRYCCKPLQTGVYQKWWNIKVVHDADADTIHVFINDVLVDTFVNEYDGVRVFKNGVYHGGTGMAIAYFRDIRYWVE
jgi:hypothetical protein